VKLRRALPLVMIIVVAFAALIVVWPKEPSTVLPRAIPWPKGHGIKVGSFDRSAMRLGLDLQGGTRLLLHGDFPAGTEGNIDDAVAGTIKVLRKRVDAIGVAESEITRQGQSNIAVQLPGVTPDEARKLLGRTALLRFCEPATDQIEEVGACDDQKQWQQATGIVDGKRIPLTGSFLKPNAFVSADQLGNPAVSFELQGDGPALMGQVTQRLLQRQMAIFLDNESLSAPVVQGIITDHGQISGLALDRARELVVQLNSGALPLQLSVLQEQNVDATLGADSVTRSVLGGEVGLLLVMLFMVLYYRLPGVLASGALLNNTLVTLAVFKLIPITLTLAGIGGFVLSIGMAVDANILIFERMKEELRMGRSYAAAIDAGFGRAWPSIRDSNITTLITCSVLWVLGGGVTVPLLGAFDAPLVQGFALTLALGVIISLFSAITVTRTFMRALIGTRVARRLDWLMPDLGPIGVTTAEATNP
jgi:preprotein translocase subunit SecD